MRVLDLFSGGGGFSRGFMDAGFEIVGAVERGYWEAETFRYNFPRAHVWNTDIRELHADDVLQTIGRPDIVIGGPPCEAFTGANARRMKDPIDRLYVDLRGRLVLHFIRMVGDLEPEAFIMENVPGILEGELKSFLREEFGRIGYSVKFHVFDAELYGSPSERRRVFLSNVRLKPEMERGPIVWDVIGDLERLDERIPNHFPQSLSHKHEGKVWTLKWGKALVYYRGAKRNIRNFIRLHPFRRSPVVMGSSRFVHPFQPRLLTPREHARLMGFPDSHTFLGPLESQYNMAGEAVPVPLAYRLARSLLRKL